MKSYRDLNGYQLSLSLFYQVHPLTLRLPKYECYELGSQLRRSADSVVTNLVEGYGRKEYKHDFIRFMIISHSSSLETINHLEKLAALHPGLSTEASILKEDYAILSQKLYAFLMYIKRNWRT